ncbi:MFS transporter, partial [Enterococcus faecalis]|nr:MFS transporter [Enterococcus faecalis]
MFIIRDKTIKFQMTAFLSSQIISQFGSAISGYAIVWYIVMESNSSIIATITTVANMLPGILLTLPAGIMSDKYSKKKIIIIADLLVA